MKFKHGADGDGFDKSRERGGIWKCRRKVMSELDLSCALSVKKLPLSTLRNDVDFCQRKDFFKKKEGSFA